MILARITPHGVVQSGLLWVRLGAFHREVGIVDNNHVLSLHKWVYHSSPMWPTPRIHRWDASGAGKNDLVGATTQFRIKKAIIAYQPYGHRLDVGERSELDVDL